MLEAYTFSRDGALAGVILNGYRPTISIPLAQADTESYFTRLLSRLDKPGSGSNLNDAFMQARISLFSEENGARPDTPKVLIVYVNNQIANADISSLGVEARALQNAGVKIVLIGIGDEVNKGILPGFVDVWFFPDDLPSMERLIQPIFQASLPGN